MLTHYVEELDLSFSKKNFIWGGIGVLAAFLVGGFFVSLFSIGLLLFSSVFYWIAKKLNNNIALVVTILLFFSLIAIIFQGIYLTACFFILLCLLLLSFNAMYILFKDLVFALWFGLVVLIGFSFLPQNIQICVTAIWITIIFFIFIWNAEESKINIKNLFCYIQNSMTWFDLLTCLLVLLSTVLLGFYRGDFFWPLDCNHPIYELSIGQSYKNIFFNVPDLSFSGKYIKFHFLSTRIPIYLSNLLGISLLSSTYFLVINFMLIVVFLLVYSFFYYHPNLKTPLFGLFFIPSFVFGLIGPDCLFRISILTTASFFLALLFLICALHFLVKNNYCVLLLCSLMLLLIKASFFMVLLGGIFIFWIRKGYSFIKIFIMIVPYVMFFLLVNYLFLSGAHAHNLWVTMPSSVFHYTTKSYFICRLEIVSGILILLFAFYLLVKEFHDDIRALAAISASGLIGWLLIIEIVEGNSYQFIRALNFPIAILLWLLLSQSLDSIKLNRTVNNLKDILCRFVFVLLSLLTFAFSSLFLFTPFSFFIDTVRVDSAFNYPKYLINAYSWLNKNISQSSVILFGFHYDSSQFIRSALSGKQLLCEGFKGKGILMESDYVFRVANIIRFYKYFVDLSDESKKMLDSFENNWSDGTPGVPLSRSQSTSVRMLHYLSFGKEWHFINRSKQVRFELKQALKKDFSQEDALDFIQQSKITHIVLENGDKPSDFLKKISREIYNEGGYSVLEVFINRVDFVKGSCV